MVYKMKILLDQRLDPLYEAVMEATEEAILNSMCMAALDDRRERQPRARAAARRGAPLRRRRAARAPAPEAHPGAPEPPGDNDREGTVT